MGKVVVGVVPFGTGNDFSRSYNWGKSSPWSVVGKDNSVLKKNAAQWLAAKTSPHDVWQIEMETQEGGGFVYVTGYNEKGLNDGLKKQHRIVDLPGGGMKSTKTMCNYFSIGAESRVGMGYFYHYFTMVCSYAALSPPASQTLQYEERVLTENQRRDHARARP